MIPPIGNIEIFVPGRIKGIKAAAAAALAVAAASAIAVALAWPSKTPFTKVASFEAKVVLTILPDEVVAESVTTGITRPWRVELVDIMLVWVPGQSMCRLTCSYWAS